MIFRVEQGCFSYPGGEQVLKDISMTVPQASITSVMGVNGAGKTTLLKCMLGLLHWTSGSSSLDGVTVTGKDPDVWKRIAYVPQARSPAFALTVLEMVTLGRASRVGIFSTPNKGDYEIARQAMDTIGIAHLEKKPCNHISGGELQMVLIARALASQPQMLVLDEPETGLDLKNRTRVLDTLTRLRSELSISSVINTHYPERALAVSDNCLLLQKDGTAMAGPTAEVVTEDNLRLTFGLRVAIRHLTVEGKDHVCVIPLESDGL